MSEWAPRFPLLVWAFLSGGSLGLGCGGGSSAPALAPAPSAPAESTTPAAAPAEVDASAQATQSGAAESAAAPAAPAPLSLTALCEKGCDRVKKKCTDTAFENCKMNCAQYDHPPANCEEIARDALECGRDAEDVTCVNIAPESCAHKFRRVVACAAGKPVDVKDDAPRIPEGWERYSSKSGGFSALMPRGVSESTEAGAPRYAVTQNDVSFSVRILPPPKDKPSQKNLLQVAMGIVGNCNRRLKLYGMVERPERVFIRFDSACADGTEWRGALVIAGGKMYAPAVTLPKGKNAEVDPFLYGFEIGAK